MSYLVLARKWRPMSFDDLVGQEHVARTLSNAIATGRVAHAFLFTGVRGVGKTTSARILAKALNCMRPPGSQPAGAPDAGPTAQPCLECAACKEIALGSDVDVREIDGASYNGVDEVRKLQDSLPFRPARDRFKIIIVDEVHMLSTSAWNAFLKTLEEPPPHVKFIFATTEVHKVPVTILSRVQRFDFKLIPTRLIVDRLRFVLERERIVADDAALSVIAREAAGSMRDAMSLLDQVIAWGGAELRGDDVSRVLGVASHQVLHDMAAALIAGEAPRCLDIVDQLSSQGYDVPHVAKDILMLLRDLVVAKVSKSPERLLDLPDQERSDVLLLSGRSEADDLVRLHQGFSQGFDDVVRSGQPRAALEMLLVRLARRPPLLPVDELLVRIANLERRLAAGPRPAGDGSRGAAGPGSRGPVPDPAGGGGRARASGAAAPSDEADPPPLRPGPAPSIPSARTAPVDAAGREPLREASFSDREPAAQVSGAESPHPPARANGTPTPSEPAPASVEPPSERLAPCSGHLLDTWRRVIDRVGMHDPELAAFLGHAAPLEISGQRIALALEPDSVFFDRIASSSSKEQIQRAALAELGARPVLRLSVDRGQLASAPTVAAAEAEAREVRRREAIDRAQRHPRLRDAVEILGARVKDLRVPD